MGGDPQRSLFCRAGADAADAGRLDLWNEFQNMPELDWPHGYFIALVLTVIVGVLPYFLQMEEVAIKPASKRNL